MGGRNSKAKESYEKPHESLFVKKKMHRGRARKVEDSKDSPIAELHASQDKWILSLILPKNCQVKLAPKY